MVPFQIGRSFARIEERANRRVNAVRADQRIRRDLEVLTVTLEGRDDAIAALLEPDQPARSVDTSRSEPLDGSLVKHAKELAAVDAELRHIVSRVGAAQLVPHGLTETIAIDQFAGPDAGLFQRGKQAKSRQHSDGMRLHVDADTELADLVRLLEYLDIDAGVMERQGRGQTANAATDNQDLHRFTLVAIHETASRAGQAPTSGGDVSE
jgi:hypothetical protein